MTRTETRPPTLCRTCGKGFTAPRPGGLCDECGGRLADRGYCPVCEGYAKAEVTAGGIDTAELSSKTMEARRVPGLYAIGEAVDVTGWLGGYNFQWAWASGVAAGKAIAARLG